MWIASKAPQSHILLETPAGQTLALRTGLLAGSIAAFVCWCLGLFLGVTRRHWKGRPVPRSPPASPIPTLKCPTPAFSLCSPRLNFMSILQIGFPRTFSQSQFFFWTFGLLYMSNKFSRSERLHIYGDCLKNKIDPK